MEVLAKAAERLTDLIADMVVRSNRIFAKLPQSTCLSFNTSLHRLPKNSKHSIWQARNGYGSSISRSPIYSLPTLPMPPNDSGPWSLFSTTD